MMPDCLNFLVIVLTALMLVPAGAHLTEPGKVHLGMTGRSHPLCGVAAFPGTQIVSCDRHIPVKEATRD